jgi:plastocyanin
MRNRHVANQAAILFLLAGLLATTGCTQHKVSFSVPGGKELKVVQMTASSFRFEPDDILARVGDRLLLQVKNVAGIEHNLTVEDPQGNVLVDLPLPAGQTVSEELELSQPGEYRFHCGKPLHSTLGMEGRIVARSP